jgi:hypothetical protein
VDLSAIALFFRRLRPRIRNTRIVNTSLLKTTMPQNSYFTKISVNVQFDLLLMAIPLKSHIP